jgi:subtilisin family serine protease
MYDSLGVEGIISVAATSNSNINVDMNGDIPTACGSNYLITVTNTTSSDLKATAGYGASSIDLGAPGTSIYSTILNNASGSLTGTSMASPQVAGAIALMWAAACEEMVDDYKLDPDGVALIMRNFLLTQGWDAIAALDGITVTGGRLNLDKAVHAVAAYANCPVGISESAHNDLINVYPNPSNGYFTLVSSAEAKPISVEVYSMMGQLVGFSSLQQLENDNYQLNLSHLPQGFYSLRILLNQNTYTFVQVIVSH